MKEIIVNLARDIEKHDRERRTDDWTSIPIERFLKKELSTASVGPILL